MVEGLRVAIAQIDSLVGDITGNVEKISKWVGNARAQGADLVCFPELAVTGYPPEDLLLKPDFIEKNLSAIRQVATETTGITAVVGFVDQEDDIFNAAAILHNGRHAGTYRKHYLPNYGVFDEDRYFRPGTEALVLEIRDVRVGISVCEDLWYAGGPARLEALHGNAEVLVNISSSPYHMGKLLFREAMFTTRATDNRVFLVYANLVGGQDELVFDGQSLVIDPQGNVISRGRAFQEELIACDLDVTPLLRARLTDPRRRKDKIFEPTQDQNLRFVTLADAGERQGRPPIATSISQPLPPEEEVLRALQLGTEAYVKKNGFREVVIGLSGGIDSALTAVIAAEALGPKSVVGVTMPSTFTARQSLEDARRLAENLGIRLLEIPVQEIQETYLQTLAKIFEGKASDVTEENLQARIRGNLLMALSNKFGWLVLATGNKSEVSVGYCTLYGDTAGGFSVLKDVPKTLVYRLAQHLNRKYKKEMIPESILKRPPTAELREGQLDTDSLPSYDVLDPILQAYVEEDLGLEEIVAMGFDGRTVDDVISKVDRNEYKRRQSPPGIKITAKAFGKERRLPITNRYTVT
jgi:NAD+ synthase (glutamine-hydrolysing)